MIKFFTIDGYWDDDKSEFYDYIVMNYDGIHDDADGITDDDVFFYGLEEKDIIDAIAEGTVIDGFVITSYSEMEKPNAKKITVEKITAITEKGETFYGGKVYLDDLLIKYIPAHQTPEELIDRYLDFLRKCLVHIRVGSFNCVYYVCPTGGRGDKLFWSDCDAINILY